eukprot:GHVR01046231.1.p1 GENE.GHVR01046231.1~~GHVR01046231.1.p1  ORF type:complete len:572 (-),score=96.33 GHVR01046231.1:34-1749(-)
MGSFSSKKRRKRQAQSRGNRSVPFGGVTSHDETLTPTSHTTQAPHTISTPSIRVTCPICGNKFVDAVTMTQVNRHVDICITVSGVAPTGSDSESVRIRKRLGRVDNGVIYFTDRPPPQDNASVEAPTGQTEDRGDRGFSHQRSDSLTRALRDTKPKGGGVEETNERFKVLSLRREHSGLASAGGLSFDEKKTWFYDKLDEIRVDWQQAWITINIDRDSLLTSSFNQLRHLSNHDLHKEFKFQFRGETAQDAGGLTREWFLIVCEALFNPDLALFCFSDVDNITYQINQHSWINEDHLDYFYFAGRVIGKAIFDRQIIKCALSRPMYKLLVSCATDLEDLAFIDQSLYNSLVWMQDNSIDNILFETFSVEEQIFGETKVFELRPGGSKTDVTDDNKVDYVALRTQFELIESVKQQQQRIMDGLYGVVPLSILKVFDFQELELLINGMPNLDIDDWKENTEYQGVYHKKHIVVLWFWNVVEKELSDEEQARLLQFCTGTSRVPAGGFKALESNRGQTAKFTIQSVEWNDAAPYPRAHTCFNRLDMPRYRSRHELLKYVKASTQMENLTGFGLE